MNLYLQLRKVYKINVKKKIIKFVYFTVFSKINIMQETSKNKNCRNVQSFQSISSLRLKALDLKRFVKPTKFKIQVITLYTKKIKKYRICKIYIQQKNQNYEILQI